MTHLLSGRAALSRPSDDDDFDVADDEVVGRIDKANAAPLRSPWMWTLAFWLARAEATEIATPRLNRSPGWISSRLVYLKNT
jgi:hypothetical protein